MTFHRRAGIQRWRGNSLTLALAGLAFDFGHLHAEITYIDAMAGSSGNTYATGGSPADTSWIDPDTGTGANDTQWKIRGFGQNANVFQAIHTGVSLPELTTEITGLANGNYQVWVFFWDGPGTNEWTISAGLTSGDLSTYSFDEPGNTSSPVAVSSLTFAGGTAPMSTEDPRILYGVNLGQASVSDGGAIKVYIDNLAGGGSTNRTWFDGVGYQLAEPAQNENATFDLGIDFNRNDAPGSPSQSLFRVIAGSGTSQNGNASSYLKTFATRQVKVTQPDGINFEFRGANSDSSRAIPGGDTSRSFLVSDFIATRKGAIDLEITGLAAGDYVFRSWHLDTTTGSSLEFAQGPTTTTPNIIEARIGGVLKDSVQPTTLGSVGLNTRSISNMQIPTLEFTLTHDGISSLVIEFRSTQSNGADRFLLLNGFELLKTNP